MTSTKVISAKLPTAEEVALLKGEALRRFGSDRALLVELDAPVNAAVVVAPFNLAAWAVYIDAHVRDLETSQAQVYAERLLWPSLDEGLDLRERWPAVPKEIAKRLHAAAGQVTGKPLVTRLSAEAPPRGLDRNKAEVLIAGQVRGELWAVEQPAAGFSCVMRRPLPDVWLAAKTADRLAREKGEGIALAALPYAREAVVWSPEPIDAILDRYPALADDLRTALMMTGGDGVAVRTKSL